MVVVVVTEVGAPLEVLETAAVSVEEVVVLSVDLFMASASTCGRYLDEMGASQRRLCRAQNQFVAFHR